MAVTCRDFRESAALDALGALEPPDRARLALHIDLCPTCAAYRQSLDRMPALLDLAAAGPAEAAPPGLEDRIVRRYAEDAAPPPRRRNRRRLRWFVPAVAGLAIGVLATLIAIETVGDSKPRQISVALHGTTSAPAAMGVARLEQADAGTVIHLTGTHLPASRVNQHYELWMTYGTEAISAGTFRVGPDGTVSGTLTCAGDPGEYERLDVTVEGDEPAPGPGHQVVLQGDMQAT